MQPDSNNYWTSPILKSTHIDIHNIVNTFALLKASSYEDLSEMHPYFSPKYCECQVYIDVNIGEH